MLPSESGGVGGWEHKGLVNSEKVSPRKRHSNCGERETAPQFLGNVEVTVAEMVGRSSPQGEAVKELLDSVMTHALSLGNSDLFWTVHVSGLEALGDCC